MRVRLDSKRKLLFLLLLAMLIMGIGYATINSITAEIQGKVSRGTARRIYNKCRTCE